MKKVISFIPITFKGLSAIGEDTSSMRRDPTKGNLDTVPNGINRQADTSKWNNYNKESMNQGNQKNPLDIPRKLQPVEGSRDGLNRGNTPNTSTDTLYENMGNNNAGTGKADSAVTDNNSNRKSYSKANPGSKVDSTFATVAEKVSDCITMANDKLYVINDGDRTVLRKEYKLSGGAIALPDGYPTVKVSV